MINPVDHGVSHRYRPTLVAAIAGASHGRTSNVHGTVLRARVHPPPLRIVRTDPNLLDGLVRRSAARRIVQLELPRNWAGDRGNGGR